MSQGLHLSQRLSQQMILSPQLQQSLALLQAPVLELKAMIQQELQQNPLLEEINQVELTEDERDSRNEDAAAAADPSEPPPDVTYDPATEKPTNEPVDRLDVEMQKLMQLDLEWRDHLSQAGSPSRASPEDEERRQFMFESLVKRASLQEYLLEQLRLSDLPEADLPVAEMLVGNIDDHGRLQSGIQELTFSTGLPAEQIERVLQFIQTLDPAGVGARDLRECLLLQLEREGRRDSLEWRILSDFFEPLGKRRFPDIARALNRGVDEIQEAASNIGSLDPHPGNAFSGEDNHYVVAEIVVTRESGEMVVTQNNDFMPTLRISHLYKDLLSQAETSSDAREYIREKIRSGKFLIKSLQQRQSTILNIAKEIVGRQREFMEKGIAFLRPMTMLQVAEAVKVHETTVSRAVSGKYIQTPQGLFEMKYFFTSGVPTVGGEAVSNASVKSVIDEMIRSEDKSRPQSDEEIVAKLTERGIRIARRTVAKYRTELGHLPSHLRRAYS